MPTELEQKFQKAAELIGESEYILFAGHAHPDGDSLGSMLGLEAALQKNHPTKTVLYVPDDIPPSLQFLLHNKIIEKNIPWYPDLVIGFDYGDYERLQLPYDMVQGSRMITFDHHPPGGQRGDVKIIETGFSSASEIVYEFLKTVGWQIPDDSAQCILTGILTDTGALAHTNTSARTLRNVGELIQKGVPMRAIYSETFAGKSPKVLNIWGDLLRKIVQHPTHNFVSAFVPFQDFREYGIILDDFTGVIAVLNLVADTHFSVFAVEYERGKIKGSLRSEEFKGIDVSRIARKLGGGGHKYAAGFSLECSMEEAEHKIIETIEKHFETVGGSL